MAFNEKLSDRIREALASLSNVEEKYMFGGVCYMVNEKMCIGVVGEEIMCRIDPDKANALLDKTGCRPMDFTGKSMKGYLFVTGDSVKRKSDLDFWVDLCLEFNATAKASKKRPKKS